MTSVVQSLSPTVNNSNTLSVLSAMTSVVPRASVVVPTSVPLSSTRLSAARMTGFVSSTTPIVPSTRPISVPQTINSPMVIPITNTPIPMTKTSPSMPVLQSFSASKTISDNPDGSEVISYTMQQTAVPLSPPPASPNARSALLNLNAGFRGSSLNESQVEFANGTTPSITIPNLTAFSAQRNTPRETVPVLPRFNSTSSSSISNSLLFPSIKVAAPNSSLPLKPTAELMNQEFEVKDYQGIIANSSLENELLNAGYAPLSKIVIRTNSGEKRTQYIKAINKKGQKVFILIDVHGYTTARSTDLTLIEAHNASIVPYSLKTGAYNCAGKDVCGVAFECGADAVCVLARGPQDLTPKEANFVFVEQSEPSAAAIEMDGSIMTYPVIRLSEIRANPALVLVNTDVVTRRLRNSAYTILLQELAMDQQSIGKLNEAFVHFNRMREDAATKLNRTLTQLEQWNEIYIANPPIDDDAKDRYRKLQYNLVQRNEGIATLLRSMKKIADMHIEIDVLTKEINDITEFCEREFATVEYANSD